MKARIKGTNTIVECRGIGTLINENKGIECQHIDCSIEVIPADCLIELSESFDIKEPFNWESFRNQTAKDILCDMIRNEGVADERNVDDFTKDNQVKDAVLYADKLISKLKEKEN
jgi:hypothetical protein